MLGANRYNFHMYRTFNAIVNIVKELIDIHIVMFV